MVFVVIRLVGEAEDRLFENIILEPQISRLELVKRIESVTRIPSDFQQIEFRGVKLPVVECPIQDIKFGETLVVQHSLLSMWSTVLDREIAFGQSHEEELKKAIHLDATALIDNLIQSRFFLVYPSLGTRRFAIEKKFYAYFDRKVDQIRRSTRAHFTKVYGEKNSRFDIDIKELFVYTYVLERSIASFLEQRKPDFDKMNLVFDKVNKTDDLLEYVDNVRRNISLFVNDS